MFSEVLKSTPLIQSILSLCEDIENQRLGFTAISTPTAHMLQLAYSGNECFHVNKSGHVTKQLLVEEVTQF